MTVEKNARLGRYEILDLLGRGAMGEVYQARDTSLGRDVALKILPTAYSGDPERLRRFDQEARAAGALNHPNIVAIFDVGSHEGTPFVVTELLEGATLRKHLDGHGIPPRKALDFAAQIARGLAAAHAKGIIHRDLKPENVFVSPDGRVKILDFGLAKLVGDGIGGSSADSLAATAMTEAGRVLGTVGYMAPEQVRGEPADQRADIFALGCVLHEMLTGTAPFHRGSAAETMAAILSEEMPGLPTELGTQFPLLGSVLRRTTEKAAGERFESARDLAFGLESLARAYGTMRGGTSRDAGGDASMGYERITFRRGAIWSARFTPDGHSVIYSASWEGKPLELFWSHIGNPEARSLGFLNTDLLSLSPTNEMAVLLRTEFVTSFDRRGTLARVPPMGGAARELLHDVHGAEWSRDGQQLAIVREKQGMIRLEFPVGNVLYQTAGWVSQLRLSPDGQRLAIADHPSRNSDTGAICVVDRKGERTVLTDSWGTLRGLAWSADGREVWFTADRGGAARGLYAVPLGGGSPRRLLQLASNLTIHDVAADGRVLVGHGPERAGINVLAPGDVRERDLSWLDWSLLEDISADGRMLLLDETAEGGGLDGSIYLRSIDGTPAVRLGSGGGRSLSPDGEWALTSYTGAGFGQLQLLPTGVGEPRSVPTGSLFCHHGKWLPDSRNLVVTAHEPGRGIRFYLLDSVTGESRPLSPEGVDPIEFQIVFGLKAVVGIGADQDHWLYPLEGGDPSPVKFLERSDRVVHWMSDSNAVLVYRPNELPVHIYRVDMATGERESRWVLTPPDPTGIFRIGRVRTSHNGLAYGYTYYMQLVDLHVISGLR